MKASFFEFRFRVWIMFAILALGFYSPWIEWLNLGGRETRTWGWLALELSRMGLAMTSGFVLVNALLIAASGIAAGVRIWGSAYLGAVTVQHAEMKAGQVLADGPYRFVRNPLYIGTFLTLGTIAVLMPVSGTMATLALLAIFLFRLILGEEAFLSARLGDSYATYRKAVPRLIPSLWPRVAAGMRKPQWGGAILGEVLPLGVFASFATLSWQYNSDLLERAVLVSFGISLVARALLLKPVKSAEAPG